MNGSRWYALASLVVGIGVGLYAARLAGGYSAGVFFIAVAVWLLAWIGWLLYRSARSLTEENDPNDVVVAVGRRRKELEREKQMLMKALKELEFDHEMGKVSDADFHDIGRQYRARTMRVMRQLDESATADYDKIIEIALEEWRRAHGKGGSESRDTGGAREAPAPATAREAPAKSPTGEPASPPDRTLCSACDTKNDADADFCKKCGRSLKDSAGAGSA